MVDPPESPELAYVQQYWTTMLLSSPMYTFVLSSLTLTSATHGTVTATLLLEPKHMNSKGSLHGTVSACIVDCFGGLAVASTGREKTGVSTDIHVSYVGGAKVGDVLGIEGRVSKVGGTMAFTNVEIKKEGGGIVAVGSHTKYVKVWEDDWTSYGEYDSQSLSRRGIREEDGTFEGDALFPGMEVF